MVRSDTLQVVLIDLNYLYRAHQWLTPREAGPTDPPEIHMKCHYSPLASCKWKLGHLMFELLYDCPPFADEEAILSNEAFANLEEGITEDDSVGASFNLAKNVLISMLNKRDTERTGFINIIEYVEMAFTEEMRLLGISGVL